MRLGIRVHKFGQTACREGNNPFKMSATGSFRKTVLVLKEEERRKKVRQRHK